MTRRSQSETEVVVVPGHSRAIEVLAGQLVVVRDVEGGQVGDLFAFVADDPSEALSAGHTRAANRRLFPRVGEPFVTTRRRPILTLIEDTSPGTHDMLIPACDPERYRLLGVHGWHASCAEGLSEALRGFDITLAYVPQPVNLFMHTPPQPDGTIVWLEAPSAAGDAVTLRADRDAIVVLSACPMDVIGINRGRPSPLGLDVLEGPRPGPA
ncbi:MAG TPA: urea carboxylase-associated family protein [Acidimicrobiales bacterium]|jgi:hypothetical protein|nr:urea carboxylase-associated family protein [Acidimicrobiales bacterium]